MQIGNILSFFGVIPNTQPVQSILTVEIAMKIKLVITCVCLGMLGNPAWCAADEEMNANAEKASPQSEGDKGQDSAAKAAKSNDHPRGKREAAEAKADENPERAKMTNADCFPRSVPDSAPNNAKLCASLMKSHPDMLFPKIDYERMPEECKPYVYPKCR
jgi:hypothetical protein